MVEIDTGAYGGGGSTSSSDAYDSDDSGDSDSSFSVTSSAGGGRGPRYDDDSAGEVVTEDDDGNNTVITGDALDQSLDPFRSDETREGDAKAKDDSKVSDVLGAVANDEDAGQYVTMDAGGGENGPKETAAILLERADSNLPIGAIGIVISTLALVATLIRGVLN